MLRLVVGYKTDSREEDPTVLFLGHDGVEQFNVIDKYAADTSFARLETCEIAIMRRARVSPHVRAMLRERENGESVAQLPSADDFDEKTIDELIDLAEEKGVDLTGCKAKADYVERIRAFNALDENTVPQLKDIAATEEVPLESGAKKSEVINAIAAARKEKAT